MAKERYFPLLPKLKEDSAVNPDKASVWEDETHDFLNALVKSLAVSGSIKDVGHIDSIPDVWARPLLFQMALFDEQKKSTQEFVKGLHERVRNEWRCILAMIALKDVRHLNLSAAAVHIGEGDSGLEQVLSALAPKESLSNDTTWSDIYVLYYQGIPIAITSPTTLVSAAADYSTAFGGQLSVPWSNDGFTLTDPIDNLTPKELDELHCWCRKLYDSLRLIDGQRENPVYLNLLRCIDEYCNDIKTRDASVGGDYRLIDAELGLNIGVFRSLNQSIKGEGATAEDSAVRLQISPMRNSGRNILLVSPEMVREFASQEGIPAAQLVVWPGISANDVTDQMLMGERNKLGNAVLGKTEFRRPEDFFTERMTVMEPGDAIMASLPYAGDQLLAADDLSAILPIRRELLDYFTPEEIAQRIAIENSSDRITVKFNFPLSGVHGQPSDYKFIKHYPKNELIYLSTNVPVIEIWPNFRREGWNKYYLYYENSEAQNTQGTQEVGKDFVYVSPWCYGRDIARDIPEQGLANRYTGRMDDFPEALLCTVTATVDGSAYAQPVETGMLLLAPPPVVHREPELTWQMGIDFGTSSTMLYYREGGKEAKPLVFEPHLYQVMNSKSARNMTFINFIPSSTQDQQDGSFLSIFHLLNPQKLHDELLPLQDGHVFWLTTQRTDEFKTQASRIDTNLKWQDDAIGRRKVAAYVKQICLQSLAEAAQRGVDKLKWNFSFPTAFSKEQQFAFEATCQEAVTDAYDNASFEIDRDMDTIKPWPESKASAYYFNKLGHSDTNFSEGAICLDIGAGTTDISIISGQPGRIVYHTSIQFAGRYLFRPIYQNYSLFVKNLPDSSDAEQEKYLTIIDADLREHSEEYLKNLKNLTGREEVKKVLQQSQMAMAGIFYYLGSLLGELHAKGVYAENHVPDIFVGGNGSRIFSWLTGGTFNSANPYLAVLKNMMIKASGLDEDSRFNINLSSQPKVEVASGMIEQRPHNDDEFFDEEKQKVTLFGKHVDDYIASSVIAGNSFVTDGTASDKTSFISAYDITKGIKVESLDEIDSFMEAFNGDNHIWGEGIAITDDLRHDILKRLNSYYVSEKDKDVKKIFVEPVFIMGLKKMMEMLPNG